MISAAVIHAGNVALRTVTVQQLRTRSRLGLGSTGTSGVYRSVNEAPLHHDSGLWFSPQPFPPGLLGQRHMDSALFDLRKLDGATLRGRTRELGSDRSREAQGSGLIDVKALVAAGGDMPRVPVMPPGGLLVGLVATQSPDVQQTQDRTTRRLLVACCLALVAIVAMLAYEALR